MQQDIKLTVDAVIFGYDAEKGVSVLLIKRRLQPFQGMWALPGGFVKTGESLPDAVNRELRSEAGVDVKYLEQLYTFGEPGRDPRCHVVTVSYFGLVRPADLNIIADSDAEDVSWFNIKQLPKLAFDHRKIIDAALKRLRGKIRYEPVGFELLDRAFRFSDLEKLYMTLLDMDLDRRNFRKKMLSLGLLEQLEQTMATGSGRPARLFRFNKKKYSELQENGYDRDLFL